MRFFGFAGRKPVVVYNRQGTRLIWIMWRLADRRTTCVQCTPILPNFNQGVEAARPVSPLNGSYHKVSTVALFLLDCSGLLPIPDHVIVVSRKRRRGSVVRRFGAKETAIGYTARRADCRMVSILISIFFKCLIIFWCS